MKLLIACLTLTGCMTRPVAYSIDPAFNTQIAVFKNLTGLQANVPINFDNLPNNLDGGCHYTSQGNYITISRSHWTTMTDDQKEQLILHELGHCMFNMQHNFNKLADGSPVSIMWPYTFGEEPCYTNNKSYYYNEYLEEAGLR